MESKDYSKLTDEELLLEKKKLKKNKIFFAFSIGFLAGILIFGAVSWSLSPNKHWGFLIPMAIPIVFIYNILKNRKSSAQLEAVLKDRQINDTLQ